MASKRNVESQAAGEVEGEVAEVAAPTNRGGSRVSAAVTVIDFNDVADQDTLEATPTVRVSKWSTLLDSLYEATAQEDSPVPRDDEGKLKYTRLGTFNNPGGARTQVKAFEAKGFGETYDFHTTVKGKQSFLWARVKED